MATSITKVFPNSNSGDLENKILNEENIVGILKHCCGKESYVISKDDAGNVAFVIQGYYIEASGVDSTNHYAHLTLNNPQEPTADPPIPDFGYVFASCTINDTPTDGFDLLDDNNLLRFTPEQVGIKTYTDIQCNWQL